MAGLASIVLAFHDFRHRRLPNAWVLALALAYLPSAIWLGLMDWQALAWHLMVGGMAFGLMFILYAFGVMGGGDVKLGAAVYLWAGPGLAFPLTVIVAWTGGVLAILGWLADRTCLQGLGGGLGACVRHAISAKRGVPYGAALAVGYLYVLWQHVQTLGIP